MARCEDLTLRPTPKALTKERVNWINNVVSAANEIIKNNFKVGDLILVKPDGLTPRYVVLTGFELGNKNEKIKVCVKFLDTNQSLTCDSKAFIEYYYWGRASLFEVIKIFPSSVRKIISHKINH